MTPNKEALFKANVYESSFIDTCDCTSTILKGLNHPTDLTLLIKIDNLQVANVFSNVV